MWDTTKSTFIEWLFFRTVENLKSTVNSVEVPKKYRSATILQKIPIQSENANLTNSCYDNYTLTKTLTPLQQV
ncbi:hypothetical protein NIES267_42910 [Calothrix parasitica NIES-267]|uniref:Uncharacterized protein n=1 Tax=Calothrix parasitica NIES-267 TaxID=1973488 RepID=A0A1Z4LUC5_9CYAN|nr:hypothetical protein NIES267_42910 [Calothrix parasitica NIES-267]